MTEGSSRDVPDHLQARREAFFRVLDEAMRRNKAAGDRRAFSALAKAAGLDRKTVAGYFPAPLGAKPRLLPKPGNLEKLLGAMKLWREVGPEQTQMRQALFDALVGAWEGHGKDSREPKPARPPADGTGTGRPANVEAIAACAPKALIGRDTQLELLDAAWQGACDNAPERPRVLVFHALGGEGKTSLVARWAVDLTVGEHSDPPLAGFAWSFYKQGTGDRVASSSYEFLNAALKHFDIDAGADAPRTDMARAGRLADLLATRRAVLILDGVEPLQFAPGPTMDARLRDDALAHLLTSLARRNRGLCVVTTRYAIANLDAEGPIRAPQHSLPRLTQPHAVELLRSLRFGAAPRPYKLHGTSAEFAELARWTEGHALTLSLMGHLLLLAHQGDLRMRDRVTLRQADATLASANSDKGHASRVLEAYVRWFEQGDTEDGRQCLVLLDALGLFDRPASIGCLRALFAAPPIAGLGTPAFAELTALDITGKRLEAIGMATCHRAEEQGMRLLAVDVHPLVREFFAGRMRSARQPVWEAAHARLFEHLAAPPGAGATHDASALEPLYQAVVHGCHAGLHQRAFDEVFWTQICRGAAQYSTSKFGAVNSDLAALASFFERVWAEPARQLRVDAQMKVASLAAFRLRSAGRFDEAEPLMRRALAHFESRRDWDSAAKEAGNLSVLYMHAGRLADSLGVAERAVGFAERLVGQARAKVATRPTRGGNGAVRRRIGQDEADARGLLSNRLATRGDPLIQLGPEMLDQALEAFRQAERIQAELHPQRPLLHSTKGYRYHELLLDLGRADEVLQRIGVVSRWTTPDYELLDRGQLAIVRARAHLIRARRTGKGSERDEARRWVGLALDSLREANYQESVVRALLLEAELKTDAGGLSEDLAQTLDLAWSLAQRGPLELFKVDILLARVRAHCDPRTRASAAAYPWGSPETDLERARSMIERMGYGRRRHEARQLAARLGAG